MEEIFVPLKIKGFEDCKVSNFGRFMSQKGKIRKPRVIDGTLRMDFKKIKDKKVIARLNNISVAHLVYTHFADNIPNCDFYVLYRDKDRMNCCIDNLQIAINTPSERQIEVFNNQATACIKHIIRKSSFYDYYRYGFDIENVIGESYYLIWKYLSCWHEDIISFYKFCTKYVRIALLQEYKNFKVMRYYDSCKF